MRWYILLSVLFLSSAVFARDLRMEELEEELQELGERSGPDPADSPESADSRELVEDERDGGNDDDGQGGNDDGQGGNDNGGDDDSEESDEKRGESSEEDNGDSGSDGGGDDDGSEDDDGTGGSSPTKRFYKRPSGCMSWKFWKYPYQTSKILYKRIHLQSYNKPKHYVSYDKTKVIIRDNFAASARFEVEPGKLEKCKGTVTFRSVNHPNLYLRHRGFKLYLTELKTNLDYKDATFYPRWRLYGKWWQFRRKDMSFESYNKPSFYIRHQKDRVVISKYVRSKLFKKDATWKVVQ